MPQQSNATDAKLADEVQELRAASDLVPTKPAKLVVIKPVARRARRLLMTGGAAAFLASAAWFGWDYWTVGRFLVSTDDAYVMADSTTVAPKISGYLSEVLVEDNQTVMAGQVLTRVDNRDYKTAFDQSEADVAAAEAAVTSKQAQLDVRRATIATAKASLDVDTAAATFAAQENKRYTDLAKTGYGRVQNAQLAEFRDASAMAAIERGKAKLASADKQIELLKAEVTQATAAAARARAIQRQAALNLSYTTITAPIDGVVGNRTLRAVGVTQSRHGRSINADRH
jgi:membrane fusion protein, multidrug efflux system